MKTFLMFLRIKAQIESFQFFDLSIFAFIQCTTASFHLAGNENSDQKLLIPQKNRFPNVLMNIKRI